MDRDIRDVGTPARDEHAGPTRQRLDERPAPAPVEIAQADGTSAFIEFSTDRRCRGERGLVVGRDITATAGRRGVARCASHARNIASRTPDESNGQHRNLRAFSDVVSRDLTRREEPTEPNQPSRPRSTSCESDILNEFDHRVRASYQAVAGPLTDDRQQLGMVHDSESHLWP